MSKKTIRNSVYAKKQNKNPVNKFIIKHVFNKLIIGQLSYKYPNRNLPKAVDIPAMTAVEETKKSLLILFIKKGFLFMLINAID